MNPLTIIFQRVASFAKRAGLVPRTATVTARRHRLQNIRAGKEAERLDRIRNPDKYLGKT